MRFNQQQADLAKQQHQADQQIANDQQREATLQTYLNDMSNLLLNNKLLESKPGDVVRQVARERTLTTLRRLKADRNRIVLQFLRDAHLIGIQDAVIDLSDADLSNDDLSGTDLSGVNLSNATLDGAILSGAFLNGAILSNAFLDGAFLDGAILSNANLIYAHLSGADLSDATLDSAFLSGADLSNATLIYANLSDATLDGANLSGARNLTQQQLDKVYSCTKAILSTGLTCPHNQ